MEYFDTFILRESNGIKSDKSSLQIIPMEFRFEMVFLFHWAF